MSLYKLAAKKADKADKRIDNAYKGAVAGALLHDIYKARSLTGMDPINATKGGVTIGSLLGGAYNGYQGDSDILSSIRAASAPGAAIGAVLGGVHAVQHTNGSAAAKTGALIGGGIGGALGGGAVSGVLGGAGHLVGAGARKVKDTILG